MKTFYGESLIHKDELIQHGIFGEIKIKYYKISRKNECKKYGIEITKNNTEESEIVTNITNNEETINMILEKLIKNRVTPVALKEVIDDFNIQI